MCVHTLNLLSYFVLVIIVLCTLSFHQAQISKQIPKLYFNQRRVKYNKMGNTLSRIAVAALLMTTGTVAPSAVDRAAAHVERMKIRQNLSQHGVSTPCLDDIMSVGYKIDDLTVAGPDSFTATRCGPEDVTKILDLYGTKKIKRTTGDLPPPPESDFEELKTQLSSPGYEKLRAEAYAERDLQLVDQDDLEDDGIKPADIRIIIEYFHKGYEFRPKDYGKKPLRRRLLERLQNA